MGLEMKYFVLKPRSKVADDPFAEASRKAMNAFADGIEPFDRLLAGELRLWAEQERQQNVYLQEK